MFGNTTSHHSTLAPLAKFFYYKKASSYVVLVEVGGLGVANT